MTTYSLFGQPPSPAAVQADNGAYTMGMQFTLSQSAPLTGIWFYSPPGAADLPSACGIFQVTGAGTGTIVAGTANTSPSWSGAAGSGWVTCTYPGTTTLAAATRYKVAVSHGGTSNFYAATSHYWDTTGAGASGLTSGIITAPNSAAADIGQDSFATAAGLTYPASTFGAANYWVDVELTTTSNTLGPAAGGGAAAQPAVPGANVTVTAGSPRGGGSSGDPIAGSSTAAAGGQCGPYTYLPVTSSAGDTIINNNVWNPGDAPGWTQVLTATSPGRWGVTATITNGTGSVVSYPDVQQPYHEQPLAHWTAMTSSWAQTMNAGPGCLAEAAYDIWLNQFAYEVMIWVDITPAQRNTLNFVTHLGQVTIGGQLMDYYHGGGAAEYIYALTANQPAGTVDVLGVLSHAQAAGLIPANPNLTTVEFGWEISTTGGVSQVFELTSFTITETYATVAMAGRAAGDGATTRHPPGAVAGAPPAGTGFLTTRTGV